MAIVYGIRSVKSELLACAIDAKSRQPLVKQLRWQLYDQHNKVIQISEASRPHFKLKPGRYKLRIEYKQDHAEISNIELKSAERTEVILIVPDTHSPDIYYIDDENNFNSSTENQRRQLEREGEAQFGLSANDLAEPVSKQDAQAKRNAIYGRQMGPNPHPLLQKPQFDGMDDKVTPDPEKNTDVQLELQKQLELGMSNAYDKIPKPPGGA